jgi:H+/Cl- antiporter ClcA
VDQPTVKSSRTANFLGVFLASYILLAASLTNYLIYDRYPLLRLDTALSFLILGAVVALISGFYASLNIWVQKLLFALLIALVIDINTDGVIWPVAAAAIFLVFTVHAKEVPHQLFAGVVVNRARPEPTVVD